MPAYDRVVTIRNRGADVADAPSQLQRVFGNNIDPEKFYLAVPMQSAPLSGGSSVAHSILNGVSTLPFMGLFRKRFRTEEVMTSGYYVERDNFDTQVVVGQWPELVDPVSLPSSRIVTGGYNPFVAWYIRERVHVNRTARIGVQHNANPILVGARKDLMEDVFNHNAFMSYYGNPEIRSAIASVSGSSGTKFFTPMTDAFFDAPWEVPVWRTDNAETELLKNAVLPAGSRIRITSPTSVFEESIEQEFVLQDDVTWKAGNRSENHGNAFPAPIASRSSSEVNQLTELSRARSDGWDGVGLTTTAAANSPARGVVPEGISSNGTIRLDQDFTGFADVQAAPGFFWESATWFDLEYYMLGGPGSGTGLQEWETHYPVFRTASVGSYSPRSFLGRNENGNSQQYTTDGMVTVITKRRPAFAIIDILSVAPGMGTARRVWANKIDHSGGRTANATIENSVWVMQYDPDIAPYSTLTDDKGILWSVTYVEELGRMAGLRVACTREVASDG